MTKKDNKPKLEEKAIRLIWGSDEDTPVLYANQLVISHAGETEFHLVFGHLSPPLTIGLEESELPESIQIKPVAKIVVSPEAMEKFVEALNVNLEQFQKKQGSGNDNH